MDGTTSVCGNNKESSSNSCHYCWEDEKTNNKWNGLCSKPSTHPKPRTNNAPLPPLLIIMPPLLILDGRQHEDNKKNPYNTNRPIYVSTKPPTPSSTSERSKTR